LTKNKSRSVWFVDGNDDYIKEQMKKNNYNFNQQVNEIIKKDRKEKENK
jgi:hypothetical protein